MNRERFTWTVSVALIALLAFQLPGSVAPRDDDYAFVRTLVDIHRQVANNYVEAVEEDKLREGALEGMLGQLDPFTMYVPPRKQEEFNHLLEGSFKGVGIQLNQLDNGAVEVVTPIEGSPAFKAGVLAGDIILKVNGDGIEGLRLPEVIKRIGGPLGTDVTLTVRHLDGAVVDLKMTREEIQIPTVKGFVRNADNTWDFYVCDRPRVAYLRIAQFTSETAQRLREAISLLIDDGMKGLILDLRFNPGGRLEEAVQVCNLFLDHGVIVSTRGRSRPERQFTASPGYALPHFPMIVLVNEHSASASEIVAGSLMDNRRALVIGERTYGKGSVQEVIPLDRDGGELKLTVGYYYLPGGRLVHRKKDATDWGVEPQILVPMDIAADAKAFQQMGQRDRFLRPATQSGPQPSTLPTTQPQIDAQLQRAVDTMVGLIVLQGDKAEQTEQVAAPRASTPPSTAPSTAPNE